MQLAMESEPVPSSMPSQYQSTYRQDFTAKDPAEADTLGRRVMMTQNMQDIKGAGDGLWRKEADVVSRHLVIEERNGSFGQTFTQDGVKPARGFGKVDTFSTPIRHNLKGEDKD